MEPSTDLHIASSNMMCLLELKLKLTELGRRDDEVKSFVLQNWQNGAPVKYNLEISEPP